MSFFTPGRMRTERSTAAASTCHASNMCLSSSSILQSFPGSEIPSNSSSSTVAPSAVITARRLVTRRMKDGRRTAVENEDDREGAAEEPVELVLEDDEDDARAGVAAPEERGDTSREPGPCLA